MKRILLAAAIFMVLFTTICSISFAQDTYFSNDYTGSVGAGYWFPTIVGSIKGGLSGNTANFITDLGLNNNGSVLADFRYKFDPTSSVYVDYFNVSNTASRTIPNTFTWRFATFRAGDQVNSSLNVKMLDVIYEKKIYENEQAYLCATIGGKYGQASLSLTDTTQNINRRSNPTGFIPEVGLFGKTKMTQNLNAMARLNGIVGDNSDKHVNMIDVNAGLTWDFYQNWAADFGYKWFQLSGKNTTTNDEMNINYGGPFVMFRYSY